MAQVAPNADEYAVARQNIFFPGVTPDLDGQCVSLVKWFMQDMTGVPDPQAARGDARYVGHTLVSQGHADEVDFASRRRGDIVCYEYGTYGHIGVYLTGGHVFEENVNMPGTTKKLVDGAYVYSSRIGSESESWRSGKNPHIYRIKSYNEQENIMYPTESALQILTAQTGWQKGPDGKTQPNAISYWCYGTGNPDWGDPSVVAAKWAIEVFYAGRAEGQSMTENAKYESTNVAQDGKPLFKQKG